MQVRPRQDARLARLRLPRAAPARRDRWDRSLARDRRDRWQGLPVQEVPMWPARARWAAARGRWDAFGKGPVGPSWQGPDGSAPMGPQFAKGPMCGKGPMGPQSDGPDGTAARVRWARSSARVRWFGKGPMGQQGAHVWQGPDGSAVRQGPHGSAPDADGPDVRRSPDGTAIRQGPDGTAARAGRPDHDDSVGSHWTERRHWSLGHDWTVGRHWPLRRRWSVWQGRSPKVPRAPMAAIPRGPQGSARQARRQVPQGSARQGNCATSIPAAAKKGRRSRQVARDEEARRQEAGVRRSRSSKAAGVRSDAAARIDRGSLGRGREGQAETKAIASRLTTSGEAAGRNAHAVAFRRPPDHQGSELAMAR